MGSQNRTLLTTLIQDAVLKLCTQNVKFDTSLEIDGIICITPGNVEKEIVIKMHRTIMKSATDPDPQWQGADYSRQMAGQYQSDIATPPAAKRRQKLHSNSPQVTPSKVVDPNSFSSDVRSNISFDEMPSAKVEPGGDYDTGYITAETYATHPYGATSQTQYEQRTPSRKRKSTSNTDTTQSEEKSIKVEPQAEIMIEDDSSSYPADGAGDTSGADYDTGQQEDDHGYGMNQPDNRGQQSYDSATYRADLGTLHGIVEKAKCSKVTNDELLMAFQQNTEAHKCQLCQQEFPTSRCMESHNMLFHNRFCSVCNIRLEPMEDAGAHGKAHVQNSPNACTNCFKMFKSASGVNIHMKQPYICMLCGKAVPYEHRLKHLKTHC